MASIHPDILTYIKKALSIKVLNSEPVSGGSINRAYHLQTGDKKYFIKINSKTQFPGMFEDEAEGLKLIAKTETIAVSKVLLIGSVGNDSFLLMEWINASRPSPRSSEILGRQLAQMHRHSSDFFGLDGDNYMGSLRQSNQKHNTWSGFFINERLLPMVKMAVEKGLLSTKDVADFEILYKNLPGLFTEEKPSLIHGDLWGGNYLISDAGIPYLIDPAVSYGNREFDIAMTTLFGGFDAAFYSAYQDEFPLNKNWEHRIDLWNLYPLLVHLNLFGLGYLGQVRDCLRKYI